MLTQVSVRNLGCFDKTGTTVNFSQETVMAGPNNTGKSTIFAGLNIARLVYALRGALQYSNELYNLNSFEAAVHNHKTNEPIEISFSIIAGRQVTLFPLRCAGGIMDWQSQLTQEPYASLLRNIWCLHPNRSFIPYQAQITHTYAQLQPLQPNGSNVINFLLEKWTDQDPNWQKAEEWLRKIDPDMGKLKTPIKGNLTYLETTVGDTSINMSLQGSGFQSAATLIAALVFSPENSTIIIEEPEVFLHPSSQEVMVDLINHAVNEWHKQVILTTHSWSILLPFYNDCGREAQRLNRGANHVKCDPAKFSMLVGQKANGVSNFNQYDIGQKSFSDFRRDFKMVWG